MIHSLSCGPANPIVSNPFTLTDTADSSDEKSGSYTNCLTMVSAAEETQAEGKGKGSRKEGRKNNEIFLIFFFSPLSLKKERPLSYSFPSFVLSQAHRFHFLISTLFGIRIRQHASYVVFVFGKTCFQYTNFKKSKCRRSSKDSVRKEDL